MHLCHTSNGVTVVRDFPSLVVFASVETGNRHFSIGRVGGDGCLEATWYQHTLAVVGRAGFV